MTHGHFDVEQIVVDDGGLEVHFHVYARESDFTRGDLRIPVADRHQELMFGRFEVPEHSCIVDSTGRVRIHEANATLPDE